MVILGALGGGKAADPVEAHAAKAVGVGTGGGGGGVSIVSSKEDDGCARLLGNGLFATFQKLPSDSSSAAQTALQTAMVRRRVQAPGLAVPHPADASAGAGIWGRQWRPASPPPTHPLPLPLPPSAVLCCHRGRGAGHHPWRGAVFWDLCGGCRLPPGTLSQGGRQAARHLQVRSAAVLHQPAG